MCTTLAPELLLRVSHLHAGLHSFIVMLGDVKWHFLIPLTLIDALALLVALTWLPLLTTTPVAAAITLVVGKAIIQ